MSTCRSPPVFLRSHPIILCRQRPYFGAHKQPLTLKAGFATTCISRVASSDPPLATSSQPAAAAPAEDSPAATLVADRRTSTFIPDSEAEPTDTTIYESVKSFIQHHTPAKPKPVLSNPKAIDSSELLKLISVLLSPPRSFNFPSSARSWALTKNNHALTKTFRFPKFSPVPQFVHSILQHASTIQHHPEIFTLYKTVEVTWTTHRDVSTGKPGLSWNDLRGMRKTDHLFDVCSKYHVKPQRGEIEEGLNFEGEKTNETQDLPASAPSPRRPRRPDSNTDPFLTQSSKSASHGIDTPHGDTEPARAPQTDGNEQADEPTHSPPKG
ncbi:MAG: hypothetical protein LQ340_005919, partial [Diploschistes diacapsis]